MLYKQLWLAIRSFVVNICQSMRIVGKPERDQTVYVQHCTKEVPYLPNHGMKRQVHTNISQVFVMLWNCWCQCYVCDLNVHGINISSIIKEIYYYPVPWLNWLFFEVSVHLWDVQLLSLLQVWDVYLGPVTCILCRKLERLSWHDFVSLDNHLTIWQAPSERKETAIRLATYFNV